MFAKLFALFVRKHKYKLIKIALESSSYINFLGFFRVLHIFQNK